MKTIAFILSFYISLLAMEPAISLMYAKLSDATGQQCGHSCSKQKKMTNCKQHSDTKTNNCCTNGVCNPFAMCSCCLGFDANKSDYNFANYSIIGKYSDYLKSNLISNYSSACFHPPEGINI